MKPTLIVLLALLIPLATMACHKRRAAEDDGGVASEGTPDAERRTPEVTAPGAVIEGVPTGEDGMPDWKALSEDEWRDRLTPEQYRVMRRKGTERPFTGEFWDTETAGTYHCAACDTALFRSDTKFDAGCGWPSFFEPLEGARLEEHRDRSHGMVRTEITCRRCGAHLGHVFDDGPPPTGLRYCINSVSLKLAAEDD